jgi:hypothetical protein
LIRNARRTSPIDSNAAMQRYTVTMSQAFEPKSPWRASMLVGRPAFIIAARMATRGCVILSPASLSLEHASSTGVSFFTPAIGWLVWVEAIIVFPEN